MPTKIEAPILFVSGRIVLDSVLHIGAGDYSAYEGAAAFYRDANGFPVVPGSTIAGAFVRDALKFGHSSDKELWRLISGKAGDDFEGSVLSFRTASLHCADKMPLEAWTDIRDQVRIDPRTRTAEDGGKFAFEVLEPGLSFDFHFRCELSRFKEPAQRNQFMKMLSNVVEHQWAESGGSFLGGNSARGMGWFHVEGLQFIAIDTAARYRSYLDSSSDAAWLATEPASSDARSKTSNLGFESQRPIYTRRNFEIAPRGELHGYGRWPLLVRQAADDEADFEFMTVRLWHLEMGQWTAARKLVIPGSSIRGVVRGLLRRLAKASTKIDWNAEDVEAFFGTPEAGSQLRFRDAYFMGDAEKNKLLVERVALDECSRGAFTTAKFSEIPIFSGTFAGALAYEVLTQKQLNMINAMFIWGGDDMPWLGIGAGASPALWRCVNA